MKIKLNKNRMEETLYNFFRKCGYVPFYESYVKVLSTAGYPRFHAYIKEEKDDYIINLHLDQKRPSYGKETAHSGEYEGRVVEEEVKRIESFL